MNYQNLLNLATMLVTTTYGVTATSAVASDLENNHDFREHIPEVATKPTSAIPEINSVNVEPELMKLEKVTEVQLPSSGNVQEELAIAKVYTYQLEEVTASTVYVKSIPVLTFLETATTSNNHQKSASFSPEPESSETQAHAIAKRINQLYQEQIDANQITVAWDEKTQSYWIKVADQPLVAINNQVILPDTTNKPGEDALQATNRLRRLLGNAQPLTEIAGKPPAKVQQVANVTVVKEIKGLASWYGPGFHGRRSANGERFNQNALTAAHKTLPFGTKVRVTNLNNNRSVIVRINDRGPYSGRRIIDLSAAAAREIGMINSGVAQVKVEVLENYGY